MSNRVLIIEDDADFADSLMLALSLRDVEVDMASNGKDGIRKFLDGEYDIAITDIKLPDLSGIEVLQKLRESDDTSRVMVMTGYRDPDLLEQAKENGADEILLKPFRINDFLDKVNHQLI